MYKNGPDGLTGNDDCGQMSAWYIWSTLGMYPLNPASGEYTFGVPLLSKAVLELPDNKKLNIIVKKVKGINQNGIASIQWNGKDIPVKSISHAELLKGGKLVYQVYE